MVIVLIFSKDGLIRSVKIRLPNRNIISHAINHLYSLEITSEVSNDKETPSDDNLVKKRAALNRKAAIAVRNKISKQIMKVATCLMFCSPRVSWAVTFNYYYCHMYLLRHIKYVT